MAGKLGKRPAVRDARTLRLEAYINPEKLPAPPATRAWDKGIASWGMMLNDQLGCCVCAAQGHAEQLVTANASSEVTVPDAAVLAVYEAVGGYVPGDPSTDNGCDMLTALKYWQATGIGGHAIAAYAACPLTQQMVETCIDLFGFCYIGFAVPNSAMAQFDAGQPWTVVSPDGGIDGGHCVCLVDYNATGPTCITWGKLQPMTWQFFTTYCSQSNGEGEAYGVVTKEWIAANGSSPSGVNLSALLADVAALTGAPTPTPAPFVPSSATVQWLQWQVADVTWIAGEYAAGNVTAAAAGQALVVSNAAYVAGLLSGGAK